MFDAEPMPFVIGQRVVEDEVFQRNTDLPDIVQERGDGERRFRDTLSLELGSEEIADRMRAFELAFDDLIRGRIEFKAGSVPDYVIVRPNGDPARSWNWSMSRFSMWRPRQGTALWPRWNPNAPSSGSTRSGCAA